MIARIKQMKWEFYLLKRKFLLLQGMNLGLVHLYSDRLLEQLRVISYGGISASLLLLCENMCNGYCYDRALLVTLGFEDDDFQLVDADIDSIRLNPNYIGQAKAYKDTHYANHCFAERTLKDGSVWVYDTSIGLVIEKSLYYKIENPKITKINSKQEIIQYCDYQDIKNADWERDKYAILLTLPMIEKMGANVFYKEQFARELEFLKRFIGYEELSEQVERKKQVFFESKKRK